MTQASKTPALPPFTRIWGRARLRLKLVAGTHHIRLSLNRSVAWGLEHGIRALVYDIAREHSKALAKPGCDGPVISIKRSDGRTLAKRRYLAPVLRVRREPGTGATRVRKPCAGPQTKVRDAADVSGLRLYAYRQRRTYARDRYHAIELFSAQGAELDYAQVTRVPLAEASRHARAQALTTYRTQTAQLGAAHAASVQATNVRDPGTGAQPCPGQVYRYTCEHYVSGYRLVTRESWQHLVKRSCAGCAVCVGRGPLDEARDTGADGVMVACQNPVDGQVYTARCVVDRDPDGAPDEWYWRMDPLPAGLTRD